MGRANKLRNGAFEENAAVPTNVQCGRASDPHLVANMYFSILFSQFATLRNQAAPGRSKISTKYLRAEEFLRINIRGEINKLHKEAFLLTFVFTGQ